MRLRIEVDETPISALLESVSIEKELDGRTSTASFKLKVGAAGGISPEYNAATYDSDQYDATTRYDEAVYDSSTYYTALPSQQSEIIIYDADTEEKHFRGTVVSIEREIKSPTFQWWTVTCVGLEQRLEKVSVNRTYTSKTARYIIQDVFDDLLPEITTANATVADLGAAMNFEAKDMTLRALLDRLAELVDAEYRISPDKALVWRERASVAGAFGFDSSPDYATTYPYDSIKSKRESIGFANRVIALGGFYGALGAELRAQADNADSQTALGKVIEVFAEPARDINNQAALDLYAEITLAKAGGVQEYVSLRCHRGNPDTTRNVPSVPEVGDVITVRSVNGGIQGEFTLQSIRYSMKSPTWVTLDLALGDYNRKLAESTRRLEKIRKNPLVPPVPPPPDSITNEMVHDVNFSKVVMDVLIDSSQIDTINFAQVTDVSITDSMIDSISFAKVTGTVTVNAANITGTISNPGVVNITALTGSFTAAVVNVLFDADSIAGSKISSLSVDKLVGGIITATIELNSGGIFNCYDSAFFADVVQFDAAAYFQGPFVNFWNGINVGGSVDSVYGYTLNGNPSINASNQFVGAGVDVGSNGVGCGGVNISGGYTGKTVTITGSFNGGTITTLEFRGGVLVNYS